MRDTEAEKRFSRVGEKENRWKHEERRDAVNASEREETMNGGVICNGISWHNGALFAGTFGSSLLTDIIAGRCVSGVQERPRPVRRRVSRRDSRRNVCHASCSAGRKPFIEIRDRLSNY